MTNAQPYKKDKLRHSREDQNPGKKHDVCFFGVDVVLMVSSTWVVHSASAVCGAQLYKAATAQKYNGTKIHRYIMQSVYIEIACIYSGG